MACEETHFTIGKKLPALNFSFLRSPEGDGTTSPSFTTSHASIQASSPLLETLISAWYVQWGWKSEYFTHGKQMPVCPSFTFCEQRGRRGNHAPLFQLQTRGMMLPACCWKRALQQSKCSGDANGSGLPTANNYLFADLLFFTSGEGDEATSPSFTTRYAAIEASSASLEVLIASLLPACGPAKKATFPTAIRLLIVEHARQEHLDALLHPQKSLGSLVCGDPSEFASTNLQVPAGFLTRQYKQGSDRSTTGREESHGHTLSGTHTHSHDAAKRSQVSQVVFNYKEPTR